MRGHAMGDLGFITRSRLYDGKYRPMAVWACKCGATLEQQIPRGELNPEAVAKRASVAGWKVDSHHSSVTRCPASRSILRLLSGRPAARVAARRGGRLRQSRTW